MKKTHSGIQEAMRLASITSGLETESRLQKTIQSLLTRSGIQEAMGLASITSGLETERRLQETIQGLLPHSGIREAMRFPELNIIESSIYGIIDKYSPISEFIKGLPQEKIILNQDETISCAGEVFNIDSLQESVKQIILNSGFTQKYRTIESNIDIIINEIRKLKKPFLEKIIIYLIIPIIVAFLTSFYDTAIKDLSHRLIVSKTREAKYIQKQIYNSEFDKHVLINYRFVIANILNVREKENKNSKLIGKLYFGKVVRVITRKRDWTLIEWADSSEVKLQGWVFTRYLKKF